MRLLLGLAVLGLIACSPASDVDRAIAPILSKIEAEKARQAALPPTDDVTERFKRIYELDQVVRMDVMALDLTSLSPEERAQAEGRIWVEIEAVDKQNLEAVLEMVPPEGWFLRSKYGEGVTETAFLVIQHSNVEQWRRFVPILEPLVAQGEVRGQNFGLMYDRLAQAEGKSQRYGSQMQCVEGVWRATGLEEPEKVDEYRLAMGFRQTLAEYEANFASYPCSE